MLSTLEIIIICFIVLILFILFIGLFIILIKWLTTPNKSKINKIDI